MSHNHTLKASDGPNFAPKLYGIVLLVAVMMLFGFWLVTRYNDIDSARDLQAWQEKLNLIAESRVSEVNGWVEGNFKEVRTLADNPSLQLYMTELQSLKPGDKNAMNADAEPAQKTYLRNLMVFTAERAGFITGANSPIPANVQQESKGGIAIVNNAGDIIVSTLLQPSARELIRDQLQKARPGKESLIDINKDNNGVITIGFIAPVYAIQGERTAEAQIGRVVGLKIVNDNLFGLLKHPGITEKTLESVLLRKVGDKIEYISPLEDGTQPLSKQVPFDTSRIAEARLIDSPGNFSSGYVDYRNKPVLETSRTVTGAPWVMAIKIDQSEAMAASNQRRTGMKVFFIMLNVIIALTVFSVWWRAHSHRAMVMSAYFKKMAARSRAQEHLLQLVSDNQPEPIYIIDNEQLYRFANRQAANEVQMPVGSLDGKSLSEVRGAERARLIAEECEKARQQHHIGYDIQRHSHGADEKIIRSAYIPLDHIPLVTLPEPTPGVLVVEQDISEVIHERERSLRTKRQLVETLVKLVDKRDPFASNHSQLVSHVANEVAIDMELDNVTVDTTYTAAMLLNIGKIVIPTELLTKTESLTSDEKRTIHDSMNAAADLLKGITFDGPVAETLRQWQEKWDGTGPLGLKGEAILISARIIAVCNAFIGMISPRSWRGAMPVETATKLLLDQSGSHFDRRVVIALIHYIDNHQGKEWLKKTLESQKSVA